MTLSAQTPVAIVGAGPVGLSLGLGLARQGVRSILVEKKAATSKQSKAPGIHVRTREVFRQWGVEQRFVDAGELLQSVRLYSAATNRPVLSIDFSVLETEADRPGILVLEQGETEKLLLDAVQETGLCDLRFNAEAVRLAAREDSVEISVREPGGERSIAAEFAVGCDGASSFVRDALGLPFEGLTYSLRPMLADVAIDDQRDALPWPRTRNSAGGLTAGIRLRLARWRIIRLESERGQPDDVPDDEVLLRAAEVLGDGPAEIVWSSRFRIHLRSVPRFRVGRVLLAGDAAHIHSPAGGQGMNAGIHDAHNLAWKLAAALRGSDIDRLLDSYDIERRAVAVESVSRYTDFITRAFLLTPAVVRAGGLLALRLALAVPLIRRKLLRRATMIDLDYPASPLLDAGERAAGVRLPNVALRKPDGTAVRLYDLLPAGAVMLDVAEHRDFAIDLPLETVIRIGPSEHRDPSGLLRRLLGGKDGWILVRPDTHIAWARHRRGGMDRAIRHAIGNTSFAATAHQPDA